jgi:hypothetical protein
MATQTLIRRETVPSFSQYLPLNNPTSPGVSSQNKLVSFGGGHGQANHSSDVALSELEKSSTQTKYGGAASDSNEWQSNRSQNWWKPIIWMQVWITLGISVGLGHHFGYQSLHEQPQTVFSQTWAHNLGTGAAFLVKSSFTSSILIALQGVLWFSFRTRAMKVSLMDKLFTITSNPLGFGPSAIRNAPLATLLAAFAWNVPLSAILSPGSLTITPLTFGNVSICTVPTFAADSKNVTFYRMTPPGPDINGPNAGIQKLANQVLAQGTILQSESPCGSNCSFEHSFYGPRLQCQNTPNPPYLEANGGPEKYWLYFNASRYGGSSKMEMVMTYHNNTKAHAGDWSDHISILCGAFNTTYKISVNYTNGVSAFTTQLTYNAPLSDLSLEESVADGSPWRLNSVMLVREIFDNYLNGTWQPAPTTQSSIPDTSIGNTILASDTKDANYGIEAALWFINKDLQTGIPELLTNLTLSTLALSPVRITTTCSTSTEQLVYYYDPKLLLIPYFIALLLCLVAFTAGTWVLRKTGVRTGEIFSQILVTTRNPFLDEISRGNSLSSAGANVLKEQELMFGELKHFEDGDGDHVDRGGTGHAAFGSAEQVVKLTARRLS